ncbi:MAG TPA: MotA/TolQ/ExbB proton channel family protein [Sphingomonas sanguinis]|uniref:motility protein A n=1 Tax=Sphingomonas sanguinis TaxID=33051 RepID=UPI002AC2DF1C|nr:MotA/TolQ/ExbB proton channel family protein [Sphingomonas sanguinis]
MNGLPPLSQFFDPAALAIVLGGTLVATLLRTPWRDAGRSVRALRVLVRAPYSAEPLLEQITHLDRIARRHGVLTLDRSVITDPDLAEAIAAIVDGERPEAVVACTRHARLARVERHLAVADVWAGAAEAAPAMGMVGTLIGLAAMFATMNDPQRIGGAMAIALLATLYGALFANLVAQPIATRLRRAARIEAFERMRIEMPLAALSAREAPAAAISPPTPPRRPLATVA